jgi:hypothetical protein
MVTTWSVSLDTYHGAFIIALSYLRLEPLHDVDVCHASTAP